MEDRGRRGSARGGLIGPIAAADREQRTRRETDGRLSGGNGCGGGGGGGWAALRAAVRGFAALPSAGTVRGNKDAGARASAWGRGIANARRMRMEE